MAKNTIKIKNYSDVFEEYVAVAAITPGMLIEHTSADKVQAHSVAEGNVLPMFAVENELVGEGITDVYAIDDQVNVWIPGRGDQVYALLADGETIVIGDELSSNGDGYLRKHVDDSVGAIQPLGIVAYALEAVDMSGSSGADPTGRIEVRVV